MTAVDVLAEAYGPLLAAAEQLDESQGWTASRLPGWTVRDLVFHLALDSQRALVALASPAGEAVDTDEVSYWSTWHPGTEGALAGLRGTRIMASVWASVRGPADLYLETTRAVLVAAERADPAAVVSTQNRILTVESLLHTLVVEAAVHHLDLEPVLPGPPTPRVLGAVTHVLNGLLGEVPTVAWDDVRYIRVGTGRAPMSDVERSALAGLAARFPLFG